LVFALVDSVFGLEGSREGPRSRLLIEGTISAEDAMVAVGELDRSFVTKIDRKRKII
jgi:hypothetical protein